MNDQAILEELVTLLEKCGIDVRREQLDENCGGFCRIRGKPVVFLNSFAPPGPQAVICARALVQTTDVEKMFLRPLLRRFIEQNTAG